MMDHSLAYVAVKLYNHQNKLITDPLYSHDLNLNIINGDAYTSSFYYEKKN
jgi:hypothetical protein